MAISTVKLTLNGQDYSLTYDSQSGTYKGTVNAPSISSYSQTDHVFAGVVTVTDTAGNTATATKSDFSSLALRVKETVCPVITPSQPSADAYVTTSTPTFVWTVTDDDSGINVSSIRLIVGGETYTPSSTPAISVTAITGGYSCSLTPTSAIPDGTVTAKYNVFDNDSNAAETVNVSFTVDTTYPQLNVSSPEENLLTNQTQILVRGTTDAAVVTVNGNLAQIFSGAFSYTYTLAEGDNTITVIASDPASRTTTVTRTVTLDVTPPVISNITLSPNPIDAGQTYIITVTVVD